MKTPNPILPVPCSDGLAFVVSCDGIDASVLVFAKDASKAKSIASTSDWLSEVPWTELRVRREPRADEYGRKTGHEMIDCHTADQQRLVRDLGWFEVEGPSEVCNECERHEWDLVPESKLTEYWDGYICEGCKKANEKLSD